MGAARRCARAAQEGHVGPAPAGPGRDPGDRASRSLIIWQGGWVFAAGIGALAVICVHELSVMFERARPVRLAAMIGVVGLVVAGTIGRRAAGAAGAGGDAAADVLPRRRDAAARADHRVDLGDDADDRLDRARRRARGAAARARPRRRAGADGAARARSSATRSRTSAGGCSAATRCRRRSRPTRPSEGLACGIVVGTLVVWYWSQTYSDEHWISGTDGLLLGLDGRDRRADRRPLRVADQARHGYQGHRDAVRGPRRRAGPRRRRAVRARRRLLRLARRG